MKKKNKKNIKDEINEFLNFWDCDRQINFLKDIIPLFELYDVEDENDWIRNVVGEENERNVRLIRTAYLLSKIAENHSEKLSLVKFKFKNLFYRMEKSANEYTQNYESTINQRSINK